MPREDTQKLETLREKINKKKRKTKCLLNSSRSIQKTKQKNVHSQWPVVSSASHPIRITHSVFTGKQKFPKEDRG